MCSFASRDPVNISSTIQHNSKTNDCVCVFERERQKGTRERERERGRRRVKRGKGREGEEGGICSIICQPLLWLHLYCWFDQR